MKAKRRRFIYIWMVEEVHYPGEATTTRGAFRHRYCAEALANEIMMTEGTWYKPLVLKVKVLL